MNRRKFLKIGGLGVGGVAVTGLGLESPALFRYANAEYTLRKCFRTVNTSTPWDLTEFNAALVDLVSERLKATNYQKPLVVLFGENHAVVSNNFAQTSGVSAILKEIKSGRIGNAGNPVKLGICKEFPHDYLGKKVGIHFPRMLSTTEKLILTRQDTDGSKALVARVGSSPLKFLPLTSDQQESFYFMADGDFTFFYNDCSIKSPSETNKLLIDFEDPLTRQVADELGIEDTYTGISSISRRGMAIRNDFEARFIKKKHKEDGINLFVHHGGADHVFGREELYDPLNLFYDSYPTTYSYKYSLHNQLVREGFDVLPVILPTHTINAVLHRDAWQHVRHLHEESGVKQGIYVTGLDSRRVFYKKDQEDEARQAEQRLLAEFYEKSGVDLPYYEIDYERLKQTFLDQAPAWIAQAQHTLENS